MKRLRNYAAAERITDITYFRKFLRSEKSWALRVREIQFFSGKRYESFSFKAGTL